MDRPEGDVVNARARCLDVIGLGVGPDQLTRQARSAWLAADQVFSLTFRPAWTLPDAPHSGWPAPATPRVDLYASCDPEGTPHQAYAAMVNAFFAHRGPWQRAILVTDGNPMLLNEPIRRIMERAYELDWEVTCYPAVSAIDTVTVDLGLRIEEDGLQIVDTARMLLGETPIQPHLGCLLLQVSALSPTAFGHAEAQASSVYEPLRCHLLNLYGATHPFFIVRSPIETTERCRILVTSVEDFPNVARLISSACSAYLPPLRRSGVNDLPPGAPKS